MTPTATAAATARPAAAGSASSSRRRPRSRSRREGSAAGGADASVSTWSAQRLARAAGACRAARRRSRSRSSLVHPLLESLQRPAQPRRDGRGADPEHARGGVPVELEHDPQREHLALAGRERRERGLELGRQALGERLLDALVECRRLLAPSPPRLGAEPVERRRPRDPEQPRARAPSARVEPRPRAGAPSRTSSSRDPRPSPGRGSGRAGSRTRRRGAPRRPRRGSGGGAGCERLLERHRPRTPSTPLGPWSVTGTLSAPGRRWGEQEPGPGGAAIPLGRVPRFAGPGGLSASRSSILRILPRERLRERRDELDEPRVVVGARALLARAAGSPVRSRLSVS